MRIPAILVAGDSAAWYEPPFADGLGNGYDSSWQLSYSLRGPGTGLDLVGTAKGSGWQLVLSSIQTAGLNLGTSALVWAWQAYAAKAGQRTTAGSGTLRVQPNLAALPTATTFDGRSQAERDLAAVQAEISARINGGATLEYTIGTRSLKKEPMAALVEIEQRCARIVRRERQAQASANGLGKPGQLGVRFR